MFKLIYANSRNQTIELFAPPLRLTRVEGLGEVETNIQTQKSPYQDGSTLIETTLNERSISIEIKIVGKNEEEVERYRNLLGAIFNPKLEGTLTYIGTNERIQISCISEHIPFYPDGRNNRGQHFQKALIDLFCPNPYWKSTEIISTPMTAYTGLFSFPLQLPTEMGTVGTTQVFINEGDVETPVQIEFRGPATNPRITNKTTGEYMRINRALLEGDSLLVDTTFGNKRVEIIKQDGTVENVLNWIDLNSTFWQLIPGPNEVEYTADAGRDNAIVSIKWRNQYLAV